MGKAFGLIVILAATYVGMTLYTEGMEHAFGGILAPIESQERDDSAAARLSGVAQFADPGDAGGGAVRPRTRVGQRVHDRVTADLQGAAARRGYE